MAEGHAIRTAAAILAWLWRHAAPITVGVAAALALLMVYQAGGSSERDKRLALEGSIAVGQAELARQVAASQAEVTAALARLQVVGERIESDRRALHDQINPVVRDDRACLSPDAGRVLQSALDRANAELEARRRAAAPARARAAPAAAARADGAVRPGWISEAALARREADMIAAYQYLAAQHHELASVVETLPPSCVRIQ